MSVEEPPGAKRSYRTARQVLVTAGLVLVQAAGLGVVVRRGMGDPAASTRTADRTAADGGARELHVAPTGSADGTGSIARPLDLATALSAEGPVRPGDKVWLRGGVYRGTFESHLTGLPDRPIVVQQYPGETATIDSNPSRRDALTVFGAWTWYWGFEVTSSHPARYSRQTGPWPDDLPRGNAVTANGHHLKFINMIVHDASGGLGIWERAVGTEAYGNLVYYNGWHAPDRGHGHGIYTQNADEEVRALRENIVFGQFSHGIHAYGSEQAHIDNMLLEGNVAFDNGALAGDYARDILVGGGRVARRPVLRDNLTYGHAETNIGYAAGCSDGLLIGNFFLAGPFRLPNCRPVMEGNTVLVGKEPEPGLSALNNIILFAKPEGLFVRMRPNAYDPSRAHLVVYNLSGASSIEVNVSPLCRSADAALQVRDAQNYFGTPVLNETCGSGTITVPLTRRQQALPVGNVPMLPPPTAPEFSVFIVQTGALK